jgi:hypothetical protein
MQQQKLVNLDAEIVNRMLEMKPAQTSAALMSRFGISYNTWTKIRAGEPLRASLAGRLTERVRSLDESGR